MCVEESKERPRKKKNELQRSSSVINMMPRSTVQGKLSNKDEKNITVQPLRRSISMNKALASSNNQLLDKKESQRNKRLEEQIRWKKA